jgi:hypothetical protein
MTPERAAPDPSASGPQGPAPEGAREGFGPDPIFEGPDRGERVAPRKALHFQFFLFPLLVVVASVGVFLFFGAIGGTEKAPSEWLDVIRTGGPNEQKQAAHQLGVALQRERQRVERKEIELKDAFYVKDTGFRERLGAAFDAAFEDKSLERQVFLTAAVGFVGDPAYLSRLEARLEPPPRADLRRAIAQALGGLDTEKVVPALSRLAKDVDEPVRNYAVQALSRHPTPASLAALREALADESLFVRSAAASALALAGDPAGKDLVARQLDPAWVEQAVGTPSGSAATDAPAESQHEAMRAALLSNGIRGALALKADDLRPRVEALKDDRDAGVRRLVRDVLDRWPVSR